MLRLDAVDSGYDSSQVLFGLALDAPARQVTSLIGRNGMGKSTTVRTVMGLLATRGGRITFDGRDLAGLAPNRIARLGIGLVPEGRRVFGSLSVEENLRMGMLTRRPGPWTLARVYELFPVLQEFRARPATALSGGQQQMVAIGRALLANPRLLLCDEISLGLAPVIVRQIYESLETVRAQGMSIVLVEQDVQRACASADTVCCLRKGRVTLQGAADAFDHARIAQAYFGH